MDPNTVRYVYGVLSNKLAAHNSSTSPKRWQVGLKHRGFSRSKKHLKVNLVILEQFNDDASSVRCSSVVLKVSTEARINCGLHATLFRKIVLFGLSYIGIIKPNAFQKYISLDTNTVASSMYCWHYKTDLWTNAACATIWSFHHHHHANRFWICLWPGTGFSSSTGQFWCQPEARVLCLISATPDGSLLV